MDNVVTYRGKTELEAEANLAEFIRHCREDLTWLGDHDGFDWDALVWPEIRWTKMAVAGRRRFTTEDQLDPAFIDFARAYYRQKNTHRPTKAKFERQALKCLEEALLRVTGGGSLHGLSHEALDEAVVTARITFTPGVQYHVGRNLREIAVFVSNRRLVPVDVSTWESPVNRPSSVRRTGKAGKDTIQSKMPNEEALYAMAELFANDDEDPQLRFVVATWALLMSAPWRINEVLGLHVDAEYEVVDDDGELSYGLRYYGSKGFGYDIKWVSTAMEPVAREAFRRLKEMTESARALARHLESRPEIPLLYPDTPDVGIDDELSLDDKATYLRRSVPKNFSIGMRYWRFRTIRDHWTEASSNLPDRFPVFAADTGLKWSDALFCMHRHFVRADLPTDWYRLSKPTANTVNDLLRSSGAKKSVFEKLGLRDSEGRWHQLTTHQARHYQSTLAERGGMWQERIAKWAGRALERDNRVYDHRDERELVEESRKAFQEVALFGDDGTVQTNPPVALRDFNLGERGPIIRTAMGHCEHDWVTSPCEKNRDCVNCSEHAWVKGNAEALGRVKEKHERMVTQCQQALAAIEQGHAFADRWLEHALKTVIRTRELVSLLESDKLEDGTVVTLNDDKAEHSHLRRALEQRLPELGTPTIAHEIKALIQEYLDG